MGGYDIVDDKVIDAAPETVWQAVLSELRGARRWWTPHVTFEPGATPIDQVGGEAHATIHTRGEHNRGLRLRFTARTRSIDPGKKLVADYVAGAFRGSGVFSVAPVDGGRSRLTMRWQARPHGWVRILAKVVNIGKEHSRTSNEALTKLAALFANRDEAAKVVGRP
jgi:uncharacterized protein YndB with AHSA1/START domain